MDDVLFTFDTAPFQTAMSTMSSGVNMLIKRVAMIGAGFLSVKKALSFMPEIGRSFSIAGDIIGRNLLWPLRKEIMPILKDMLAWVRDHRAAFVRWGSYLVNIFKIIKNIVVGFIDLLNRMWERLSSNLERIFGKTTKTVSEVINLILFKISAMASFIMITLEPVFEWIQDMFVIMLERAKIFFGGFVEGAGDMMEPLNDIIAMLGDLGNLIMGTNENTNALTATFRILGAVVGGAVRIALEAVAQTIDTIVFGLKSLINVVRLMKALAVGGAPEIRAIKDEMAKDSAEFGKRTRTRVENSAGTVSRVIDTGKSALGFNKPSQNQQSQTTNLSVAPITINVTEGDAKKAGEDYGKSLQRKLIDQDVLSGGRR